MARSNYQYNIIIIMFHCRLQRLFFLPYFFFLNYQPHILHFSSVFFPCGYYLQSKNYSKRRKDKENLKNGEPKGKNYINLLLWVPLRSAAKNSGCPLFLQLRIFLFASARFCSNPLYWVSYHEKRHPRRVSFFVAKARGFALAVAEWK